MSASPAAAPAQRPRSRGEAWEGVAFTFCRAGTIVLAAQLVLGERAILPFVAFATALLYGVVLAHGKRNTRCILRYPWLVIVFWGVIGVWAAWLIAQGQRLPALVG